MKKNKHLVGQYLLVSRRDNDDTFDGATPPPANSQRTQTYT